MIIRGHTDEAVKCIESLQGLYDECIIAVDDREDSNEVYERLLYYPNVFAYRQSFAQFGRYDLARQDALNRVSPYADFIGWCDHDEILISPKPIEIRQWLYETQPDAVDVGLLYDGDIGGHVSGNIYYRTRIWKKSVERTWQRPCHEHPTLVNGQDNPILNKEIIFKHIKLDNSEYRATHHIELMQKEIDGGSLGWVLLGDEQLPGLFSSSRGTGALPAPWDGPDLWRPEFPGVRSAWRDGGAGGAGG